MRSNLVFSKTIIRIKLLRYFEAKGRNEKVSCSWLAWSNTVILLSLFGSLLFRVILNGFFNFLDDFIYLREFNGINH